jgi:hypothetical protein
VQFILQRTKGLENLRVQLLVAYANVNEAVVGWKSLITFWGQFLEASAVI